MNDPKSPTELMLPASVLPTPSAPTGMGAPSAVSTPTGNVPSPGIALAAGRVPVQPTLPDWDPASLSLAVQRVANDLFGGGAGHAMGGTPMPSAVTLVDSTRPTTLDSVTTTPPSGLSAPATPSLTNAPSTSTPAPDANVVTSAPASAPTTTPAPVTSSSPSASIPSSSMPSSGNPWFVAPSLDHVAAPALAGFGATTATESFRLPFVETSGTSIDAAPYFVPQREMPALDFKHVDNAHDPLHADTRIAETSRTTSTAQASQAKAPAETSLVRPASSGTFDPYAIKREFPILNERVNGKQIVWLDNAATTQKPRAVIDRLTYFYEHENSNIHRAAHTLAARATDAYENARETVRKFINAGTKNEIMFVRGATEGINLIAQSWGRRNVNEGDEIVLTHLEHHANIVPWQMLCLEKKARLRIAPVDDTGQILLDQYEALLNDKTKLVAMPQVSNALGTVTPAQLMIDMAHRRGIPVMLDGAQSVSHMQVDVQQLDCDFFVFSGHKVFAPTGIGAVFAKQAILDGMPPWQGGGNMIKDVTFEKTQFQPPPMRFEAGTGNIADAVGLGAALDWLMRVGLKNVEKYEHDLLVYATEKLLKVPGLTMIGTALEKAGVLSFVLAGHDTNDVATGLDQEGIAVRGGHHCAQPILRRFGQETSVRASLAVYNVCEDIDALVDALHRMQANKNRR